MPHGKCWHNYSFGKEIDYLRTKELKETGYKVLHFWDKEILIMNKNEMEETIKEI